MAAPFLLPGLGWSGPTEEPAAIGDPEDAGYDAKAIARWDVVPYQTFDGEEFLIGIPAFHMNGIDRVEFAVDGGDWVAVSEPTLNTRTGIVEYTAALDASNFEDGLIEVRAIAYPATAGQPRLLDSLFLYANPDGTLTPTIVTVGSTGADYNNLKDALNAVEQGGVVEIIEEGEYSLDDIFITFNRPIQQSERIVTIRGASGLDPDNVILTKSTLGGVTIRAGRIRLQHLSVNFDNITLLSLNHGKTPRVFWLDDVKWFQTIDPQEIQTGLYQNHLFSANTGSVYATDCRGIHVLHGVNGMALARECYIDTIWGDGAMNSRVLLNNIIRNFRGQELSWHSDVLQYYGGGPRDNNIVYNLDAEGQHLQGFFFDWEANKDVAFNNFAFINIRIDDQREEPGNTLSQISNIFNHVLFRQVTHTGLSWIFRDDSSATREPFTPTNVLIEDSLFSRISGNSGWEGVNFADSHVVNPSAALESDAPIGLTFGDEIPSGIGFEPFADPPPPELTISNPIITDLTDTTATLHVSEATGGATPYTYQWYKGDAPDFSVGGGSEIDGATSRELVDDTLSPEETTYYKVRVTDGESAVATSAALEVTTLAEGSPLTPGTISVGQTRSTSIGLDSEPAFGGTAPRTYQWYMSQQQGFTPDGTTELSGQTELSLDATGLTPGTTYYFKLVVTDAAMASATSDEAQAETGPALQAGTITQSSPPTCEAVYLESSVPSGGDQPYTFQWHRSTTPEFQPDESTKLEGKIDIVLEDDDVSPSTTYYYVIAVEDVQGAIDYSDEFEVTTEEEPVVMSTPFADAVQAIGSVARWYKLHETEGATAADAAENADGSYNGGATLGQTALSLDEGAWSVELDGVDGYIGQSTIGLFGGPSGPPLSLAIVFRLPETGAESKTLLAWGRDNNDVNQFTLNIDASNQIMARRRGTSNDDITVTGVAVNDSAVHLAVLSLADATTAKLYLDNRSPVDGSGGEVGFNPTFFPTLFRVGARVRTAGGLGDFPAGHYEHAILFNKALSDAEVASLWAALQEPPANVGTNFVLRHYLRRR